MMAKVLVPFFVGIGIILIDSGLSYDSSNYCSPKNNTCWPSESEIEAFNNSIYGIIITEKSNHKLYNNCSKPINSLISDIKPHFILIPYISNGYYTKLDILSSLSFINKHNLELTILSSGHSYFGRSYGISSESYSFQINFKNHKRLIFDDDNNPSYLISETGVNFKQIYSSINKINTNNINLKNNIPQKIFPGGDCHTVSLGGFSMGGGHGPFTPYLGMAIDNLVQIELITSNLSHVIATKNGTKFIDDENNNNYWTDNTDLYWALRGGGGGTFGIALNYTYNISSIPSSYSRGFTNIRITFPFYFVLNPYESPKLIADKVLNHFWQKCLPNLSNRAGGYLFVFTFPGAPVDEVHLSLINFDLLYIGNITDAKKEFSCITEYHIEWQLEREKERYTYYSTFWEWELNNIADDYWDAYYFSAIYNQSLLSTNVYTNALIKFNDNVLQTFNSKNETVINNTLMGDFFASHIIIGGKASKYSENDSSITPGFRNGRIYVEYGCNWRRESDKKLNDRIINFLDNNSKYFNDLSIGSYFNEDRPNNPNWINNYWGNHNYKRLQKIKNDWDPNNRFTCHHCVGDNQ